MEDKFKWMVCLLTGAIANILGGWDIWLISLITVIILDVITGVIRAILMHSNKSDSGGLSSKSMFQGGVKKLFILMMVALATVLDSIISPDNVFIRVMVVSYYIANESLSILENVGACGLPLPKILYQILDNLKNSGNEK